jgi:hypothetical protein
MAIISASWSSKTARPGFSGPGSSSRRLTTASLHPGHGGAALRGGHARGRHALVEQGRRDPLMPAAALIQQVLIQPDNRPGLQHVGRRDPALGQVPGGQVRPQVPAVCLVGLGVPLAAAQRRGVGRLGQVRGDARRGQLLAESAWSAVPALPLARF